MSEAECRILCVVVAKNPMGSGFFGFRGRLAGKVFADRAVDKKAFVPPFTVAGVYAQLGDREQMYEWLDKGIEQRSPASLKVNIAESFDAYRSEPRFQGILRRVGLSQ